MASNCYIVTNPMTQDNRRAETLKQFLAEHPEDAFARYGLAMEYSKSGETDTALQEFDVLLQHHPDYTAAYFMAAQALAKAGRAEEARRKLQSGIACAEKTGDAHAKSEMEAMLQEIAA